MGQHAVKQGDCLSSLADAHGFGWETLWNHPENAALKAQRKDPNQLRPGDRVFIPEKTRGEQSAATEKRHRYQRKGAQAMVRLTLLDLDHKPRANRPYVLEIDGETWQGTTDAQGKLEHKIKPGAARGSIRVKDEGEEELHELALGHVDPDTETSGLRHRLGNLGFPCEDEGDKVGEKTAEALRAFQRRCGLAETGEADDATRARLTELHGS